MLAILAHSYFRQIGKIWTIHLLQNIGLQIPVLACLLSQRPVSRSVYPVLTYHYKQELDFILVFPNTISLTQRQCYSAICVLMIDHRDQRPPSLYQVTTSFLHLLAPSFSDHI